MTTLLLLVMLLWFGFFWLAWWLGQKAKQNPAGAADLGIRIGRWFLK